MADERKRRRWPWVIVVLLVLYPLSIGPVAALHEQGVISREGAKWLDDYIYAPFDWLALKWNGFGEVGESYIMFWKSLAHRTP